MKLRRFLYRVILLSAQVIIFSVTIYATMLVVSYNSEKQYLEARIDPPGHFPILITRNDSLANTKHSIEIVEWDHYKANLKNKDPFSTPLISGRGEIIVPGQNPIQFSTHSSEGNPIVDIEQRTERGTIFWRYSIVEEEVVPISRRAIGYAAAMFGIFPGLFLAWLVGRLSNRFVNQLNND